MLRKNVLCFFLMVSRSSLSGCIRLYGLWFYHNEGYLANVSDGKAGLIGVLRADDRLDDMDNEKSGILRWEDRGRKGGISSSRRPKNTL